MINLDEIKKEYEVNDEQAMALDIDKNIALHAGAGSGKTRVLTRRFLKLMIDKNANVDDIVAITFTKKAALEMKERVLDLVNEFLEKEQDEKKKQRLKKIKEDVPLANISTFHSFCDTLIKENYYLIGIEPMYQIIEEVDTLTLLNRFSEEILNKYILDEKYTEHFNALFEILGVEFVTKGDILKEVKGLYKEIKTRGDRIEEAQKYVKNNIINYFKGDEGKEPYQLIVDLVMDMVVELDRMYKEEKRKSSLLDFNDLENYTLSILEEHSDIKQRLRERYKYFLVDEFQDTNDIQLKILMHLTEDDGNIEEGKLFVVGDIKQSIYLFRGANYKVFEEVTEKIKNKLNLSTNYRSHNKIVEIINDMFEKLMDSYEASKVSSKIDGEAGFVYEFIKEEKQENKNEFKAAKLKKEKVTLEELATILEETKQEKRSKEAEYVADKIIELNKKGIEYKDIAILFRNRNNILEFETALKNKGIPYTILGGIGFYERQEIKDLINLVRFIYRQEDKLSFLGVIRSPFVGLSDNEVIEIFSVINKEGKIDAAIGKNEKLDKLFELKSNASFLNAYSFLKYADKELNIKEILLASEDGIQKYRNFEKFLEIANEFDNKGIYSSLEFAQYVENLMDVSDKESQAFLDTENSDAVKIMTVHASKGLEFEAVFVPCLDYTIEKNSKSTFIYDKFEGQEGRLGIAFKDENINEIYDNINQKRITEEKKEEIRILYVAATRAIRFLSFSGVEKTKDRAKNMLAEMEKLSLDSYKEKTKEFEDYKKDRVSEQETENELNIGFAKENIELEAEYIPKSLISISRYMAYKQCPRKYFFKFIAKIDEEALNTDLFEKIDEEETEREIERAKYINAAKIGSFVHSILEDTVLDREVNIDERIKTELGEIENWQRNKIYSLIENFNKIEKEKKNIKDTKTEFEFRVRLLDSNIMLTGFIDRVDIIEENGITKIDIIDYKTNKVLEKEDIERIKEYYTPQFMAYNYAIKKIYPDAEINKMYLYLLDCGDKVEISFTQNELENTLNEILDIFKKIELVDDYQLFSRCNCDGKCGYNSICSNN